MEEPQEPICQSCAMPLVNPEDFGTDSDGTRNLVYCRFCFQDGDFTDPELTLEGMIAKLVAMGQERMGMSEEEAREMANTVIPHLKRWR